VVPTIVPVGGTLPLKNDAFKLVTCVSDRTTSGAVPDVTVEIN
jgi:hypothetical protein